MIWGRNSIKQILTQNWSGPETGLNFWIVFAIFFPAVTGFKENQRFNDVMILNFGGTMAIFPDTELWNNKEKYNIKMQPPTWQHWHNHISTPSLRKKWWQELYLSAKQNGFQVLHTFENSIILEGLTLHESV